MIFAGADPEKFVTFLWLDARQRRKPLGGPGMKPWKAADYFIQVNFHGVVLRMHVFSHLKVETFLSHSHAVTGKVENILRHSVMFRYKTWSMCSKVSDAVVWTVRNLLVPHFLCHSSVIVKAQRRGQQAFMKHGKSTKRHLPCFHIWGIYWLGNSWNVWMPGNKNKFLETIVLHCRDFNLEINLITLFIH